MHVAVIDIGKPNKNLGWAIEGPEPTEGTDLNECIREVARALQSGPVALGFEAPMYVPMRPEPDDLTKARVGECLHGVNRPYSASAGAAVLVAGAVVVPYVLSELRILAPAIRATLDWRDFVTKQQELLLFEAFVSNQKKTSDTRHIEDAKLAASDFLNNLKAGSKIVSAICEPRVRTHNQ